MNYIPATQANELIDRLLNTLDAPNEFALRRLENDAKVLMRVDPVGAHAVLGTIAAVLWDANGVREHFRIALQHADSFVTRHNYSIALALVDLWQESFDAASTALKQAPDDTIVLRNAIERAIEAGQFRMARECCRRLNTLLPTEHPHDFTDLLERFVAMLDAGTFGESNVRRVLEIAESVQRAERIHSARVNAKVDQDEPDSFLFRRFVNAAPETAAVLNSNLAEEIVSHDDLLEDPGTRFVPLFVGVGGD